MTMAPEHIPDVQSSDAKPGKILRCPSEGCGKIFRSAPGYRYHLKSHDKDPRPHVCQCCHKKFKSANGLKYHLRKAHQIEPVLSKQNLGGTSPKSRDSISSEEDPYISLNDSYPRNFLNGSGIPSPLVKSPLGLTSPLLKNLPSIPSPLIKSPMDMGPYLSGGSTGSSLQSPYINKDRYSNFYHKLNGESSHRSGNHSRGKPNTDTPRHSGPDYSSSYPRSSLSEYTQQCQQANNEFSQQIQRLSTGDVPTSRLSASDYLQSQARSSCQYYNCQKTDTYSRSGSFSSDYHRNSIDCNYPCISGDKLLNNVRDRETNNNSQLSQCNNSCNSSCNIKTEGGFNPQMTELTRFKIPVSTQNSEQIVPDISSPFCGSPTEVSCDKNNNNTNALKSLRGASESSNETELSDCVFQNENSMPAASPTSATEMISLSSTVKKEPIENSSCSKSNPPQPAKPLLSRRTSRTKSIPPALVINPSPTLPSDLKSKDLSKLDPASRLRYLAEVATSPRSPFHQSPLPLPLTLTPSLLPGEGTPDWIKSPSKFSFLDKPSFLLTPTISRSNPDTSHSDSLITSNNSLPASPFLDNIQTPSFWPTQIWPTPVWLCFLKGCSVKFEQDDNKFMTTEDVAAFCTTPGGRRRDDMNFYTSGMKVVSIREKPSLHSSRDMVELTFEQIIPGTQRLVAKAPIDHPFYVKHKGWSAINQAEAMARYGIPFRSLQKNDIVITPSSKSSHTPCNTLSPCVTTNGPQVFTFSIQDTSKFSLSKKPGFMSPPPPVRDEKPVTTTASSTSVVSKTKPHDTIVLTYSLPSSNNVDSPSKNSSQQRLVNELKSISEAMKSKAAKEVSSQETDQSDTASVSANSVVLGDTDSKKNSSLARKKRRKPLAGNEKDRRPMNGFMLFAKEMRVTLTKLYPGKDNRAISKLLGERWKELSEDKREDYSRMAKEMADERMKLNPDCWKRKHRKEKDAGSKSSSGENESPDYKKQKLQTPEKELAVTSEFAESQTATEPVDQNKKT